MRRRMDVPARAIQDARMRRLLPLALAVLLPHLAAAQSVSLQDNALQDWTRLKDTMMKIAAAMPEDKFGYRATPPERTWGEQILHVAEANIVQMGRLGAKVPPFQGLIRSGTDTQGFALGCRMAAFQA